MTGLTLSVDGERLAVNMEDTYAALSVERQPGGYVNRRTYEDCCNHEAIRSGRATLIEVWKATNRQR